MAIVADMPMKGIDISCHNGENIDFSELKKLGVEVVIIKSNEGKNYVDPKYEENYQKAKAADIPNIGFYHFMSEKTDPKEQAKDFWEEIKDKDFNIKPVVDIETNKMGRNAKEVSERCLEFLEEFERLSGEKPMIYSGGCFSKDLLTDSRLRDNYELWVAHYNKQPSNPMDTGFETIGHQYSEYGNLNPAIKGNVDVNVFSEDIFREKKVKKPKTEVEIKGEFKGNKTRVKDIQQRLIVLGYDLKYGADGIWGIDTLNKLKEFQKDNNLVVDGLCGEDTFSKLTSPDSSEWLEKLKRDSEKQKKKYNSTLGNLVSWVKNLF